MDKDARQTDRQKDWVQRLMRPLGRAA